MFVSSRRRKKLSSNKYVPYIVFSRSYPGRRTTIKADYVFYSSGFGPQIKSFYAKYRSLPALLIEKKVTEQVNEPYRKYLELDGGPRQMPFLTDNCPKLDKALFLRDKRCFRETETVFKRHTLLLTDGRHK